MDGGRPAAVPFCTMLLIPARVGPSRIHGNGLFATQAVLASTPIWRHHPGFDPVLAAKEVESLPEAARNHVHWFGFQSAEDRSWHLSGDLACFMNHDPHPNTGRPANQDGPVVTVALRDIAEGEELTCDYRAFDAAIAEKLGPGTDPSGT